MEKKLEKLTQELKEKIEKVESVQDIIQLRSQYVGKNSPLNALMKTLRDLPKEDRPKMGQIINSHREVMQDMIKTREIALKKASELIRLKKETIDVTMPSRGHKVGALHPLTKVKQEIVDAFIGLGFNIAEGPEIETDYNCFQALNIPKDHPARDMQDTFYISDNTVLRSHTSSVQVRTMLKEKPPIKIVCPGRVYRADDDATHSPMFNQIEGLVIDKNITLCDLKGVLDKFAKTVFNEDTETRFRSSHFPFTEPSVEVDVSCMMCGGKGCKVCKGTGWIEILGSGVVHKNVLENCGIDSSIYSGFAFGMGIERIAMIKYGIPDIRMLYENDVRFLKQFR